MHDFQRGGLLLSVLGTEVFLAVAVHRLGVLVHTELQIKYIHKFVEIEISKLIE